MKSMRDRYFENFEKIQTPADNRLGFKTEYRYKGLWYAWDCGESELRREKAVLLIAEAISAILYIIAATRRVEFNALRITAGFAVVSIVPFLGELWGVIRFTFIKQPMMVMDFNEIRDCIQIGTVVRVILLAAAVLTGLFTLIFQGHMSLPDALTILAHVLTAGVSVFIFLRYRKLNFRILRNVSGKAGPEV